MGEKVQNMPCEVCGGRGGWYEMGQPKVNDNYTDCPHCDGVGFYKKEVEEEAKALRHLLVYNSYRKVIVEHIKRHGKLLNYSMDDFGKTIEIEIIPFDKVNWLSFSKMVVKLGFNHQKLDASVVQNLKYNPKDDLFFNSWTITLKTDYIKELDGFVAILTEWTSEYRK